MFIHLQLIVITCHYKVLAFRLGVKVPRRVKREAHFLVRWSAVAVTICSPDVIPLPR